MTDFNTVNNNLINNAVLHKEENRIQNMQNQSNQSFKDLISIKKAATEMESFVLSKYVGTIYANVQIDPLVNKESSANDIYKTMMVDAMCEQISKTGSFGIAEMVEKQLVRASNIAILQRSDKK
jgi:Rod binding domain-containing protein